MAVSKKSIQKHSKKLFFRPADARFHPQILPYGAENLFLYFNGTVLSKHLFRSKTEWEVQYWSVRGDSDNRWSNISHSLSIFWPWPLVLDLYLKPFSSINYYLPGPRLYSDDYANRFQWFSNNSPGLKIYFLYFNGTVLSKHLFRGKTEWEVQYWSVRGDSDNRWSNISHSLSIFWPWPLVLDLYLKPFSSINYYLPGPRLYSDDYANRFQWFSNNSPISLNCVHLLHELGSPQQCWNFACFVAFEPSFKRW